MLKRNSARPELSARLRDDLGLFLPAAAAHAIAERRCPVQFVGLAGLETIALNRDWLPNPRKGGVATRSPFGGSERTCVCACEAAAGGITGRPA